MKHDIVVVIVYKPHFDGSLRGAAKATYSPP